MSSAFPFTVRTAAQYLGVHEKTLYQIVARHEIECIRTRDRKVTTRIVHGERRRINVSGRIKFSQAALDEWIARHRVPAQAAKVAPALPPSSVLPMPARRRFS